MARNKDLYDEDYSYGDEDVPGGRDALINELSGQDTSPFAGVQNTNGPIIDYPEQGQVVQEDTTDIPYTPPVGQPDVYKGGVDTYGGDPNSQPIDGEPWAWYPGGRSAWEAAGSPIGPNVTSTSTTTTTSDPVREAVLAAFKAKGITPRDDADLNYWIDKINQTGGWDGAGNQDYWTKRMAQSWGGVGDYLERPIADMNAFYGQDVSTPFAYSAGNTTTSGSSSGSSAASSVTGTTTPTTTTPTNGMNSAIRSYIEKIMGGDPYAVDQNDPAFRAASDAYARSQQRSLQHSREAMAERMNAAGTMGGGMDTWLSGALQNMGENQAAYDANLVLDRQKQQLAQLENALKVGAGLLTADQEAEVKKYIADLQAKIAEGELAYKYYNTDVGDRQFYDRLGFDYADLTVRGNGSVFNNPLWG